MTASEPFNVPASPPLATPSASPAFGRIGLNSFWLLAARIVSLSLGLLFSALLARALGQAGLGQFAFISATLFVGNAATTFGLDTLLQRDAAAARASATLDAALPQTISAVLLIQLSLSAAYITLLWLVAPRLPNQTAATLPALGLAAVALVPLAFSTIYSAILRANERMADFLAFNLVTGTVTAAGGVLLFATGGGLIAASGVLLVAQTAGALAAAALCRRAVALRWRWVWPTRATVRRALRLGGALAALMLFSVLYQRSGVMLLSLINGDAAAGAYSAAARVMEALKLLPGAFFGAMFPVLARAAFERDVDREATRRLYTRAFAVLLALCFALAAGTALAAPIVIRLLFGSGYEAAASVLRIMCLSLLPTVATFRLSFDLVVHGRERIAAASMALTLLVGGTATAWLIARAGVTGAAWGLVIGELAQVVILLALGRRPRFEERL